MHGYRIFLAGFLLIRSARRFLPGEHFGYTHGCSVYIDGHCLYMADTLWFSPARSSLLIESPRNIPYRIRRRNHRLGLRGIFACFYLATLVGRSHHCALLCHYSHRRKRNQGYTVHSRAEKFCTRNSLDIGHGTSRGDSYQYHHRITALSIHLDSKSVCRPARPAAGQILWYIDIDWPFRVQ